MRPFHPVIKLPADYDIFDFTKGYDPDRVRGLYGVGRYDEDRKGMYTTELFKGARTIHVGVDLAAPVGTDVYAFDDGIVFMTGINPAEGDYGGTVITQHVLDGQPIWALHGHLSHSSVSHRSVGSVLKKGDVIGWIGDEKENGGWNPHVHFQLSVERPSVCDLPGAVSIEDRAEALRRFPDPRLVLGELY